MRHFIIFLVVVLLVELAVGDVTISLIDNGDLTADIVVVASGEDADEYGSLVAGIALDVSVDVGVITDVFNYKTTGESAVGDAGYGIFPGTITFIGGYPEGIMDTGTPVAPTDAPDAPGQIDSSSIVLEFGALYDQRTPEAAPDRETVLCTIAISEYTTCGTLTLAINEKRGGIVMIGGGKPSAGGLVGGAIQLSGCSECDCYHGPADYDEAVSVGCPISWCESYQCRGDADGVEELIGRSMRRVGYNDIAILLAGFNQSYTIGDAWIAADFDHKKERIGRSMRRVGYNDIAILLQYFNTANVPGNCGWD